MAHSAKTDPRVSNAEDEFIDLAILPEYFSSDSSDSYKPERKLGKKKTRALKKKAKDTTKSKKPVSAIIAKPYSSLHTFENIKRKMTEVEIAAAIKSELKGAVFKDVDDLVDNIFRGQDIDWANILTQMTSTVEGNIDPENKDYNSSTRTWNNWPSTNTARTEAELGKHLNKVADIIREKLGIKEHPSDLIFSSKFATSGRGTVTEFTNDRKPDLIISRRCRATADGLSWRDFRLIVSLKVGSQRLEVELRQLADYARLCFHAQPNRRYVLGIGFRHTTLTLYVFDRSGVLVSREYDVNEHPEEFLRIAIGVLFLSREALGYDASFYNEKGKNIIKVQEDLFKITKFIFNDRSIRGRGTVCCRVQRVGIKGVKASPDSKKVRYVVKDAWVDRSRALKEVEMLKFLKECNIRNVSQLVAHEIVKVKDHITNQLVDDNTGILRNPDMSVEIREHHRIVMTPYGVPITHFKSLIELMYAILDILQTLIDLDEKGIVHRDISLGNLVLVAVEGSTYRKGFIIDFDYAIKKDRKGKEPADGQRTGTVPFMAIDILNGCIDHTVVHDAESLLYVLIWIAFTQAGAEGLKREITQQDFDNCILSAWSPPGSLSASDLVKLSDSKYGIMLDEIKFEERILYLMDPFFGPLQPCLTLLRDALFPPRPRPRRSLADVLKKKQSTKPEISAIPRDKEDVLNGMKGVLKDVIEYLEKASKDKPVSQNPSEATLSTTAAPEESVETQGGKKGLHYAEELIHPTKLRYRFVNSNEKTPVGTPQNTVVFASGGGEGLREHVLRASYTGHQTSLKRSRNPEDGVPVEDNSSGSSKKLKTSPDPNTSGKASGDEDDELGDMAGKTLA